ncbi:MAG TPA: hypothetical protein ACHBX6_11190 [Arsenophonus nasoniae]|uniref:hypothetical protein n=1 Tax=Arsenophonus nasoniae TaxID=638 RepID=UPI003879096F
MSTILNLGHNHNYNFNESRLNRVMNAETLAEAQYMGLWDRIKDFFQGGVKRQAIEALFDQINQPARHDASPNKQLEKFERLIDLAKSEQQTKFTVEVNPPNQAREWSFQFKIGQYNIYQSNMIPDQAETSYDSFCSVKTEMEHRQFIRQNAELLEQVNDFFQDEMKSQALEKLFQIYHPSSDDIALNERLQKFEQLIQFAKPEQRFDFTVNINPPNEDQQWSYQFKIGQHNIYQSDAVIDKPETSYSQFCVASANLAFNRFILASSPDIFTLEHCIGTVIECAVDGKEKQQQLANSLEDTNYSCKNLLAIEDIPNPEPDSISREFVAHFKTGDLVFSNRTATLGELRGEGLKQALQNKDYNNLYELFSSVYRTEQDPMLRNIAHVIAMDLIQSLTQADYNLQDPQIAQALHKQTISDTGLTLGILLGIPQPNINDTDNRHRNIILEKKV